MQTEELILNHGCERKVVKKFGEALPDVRVAVFSGALVVEAIDLSDLSGLVISSEDGDSVFVADFKGEEESDCLDRVVA